MHPNRASSTFALLGLLAALPACAADPGRGPVCARPEVLRLVSDRLEQAGVPPRLEAQAIGQSPGPAPNLVACAVWVRRSVYNTPILGAAPAETRFVYRYTLQLRENAAFLLADPVRPGLR